MPVIKPFQQKTDGVGPAPQDRATPDSFGGAQADAKARFAQTLGQAGDAAISTANVLEKHAGDSEVSDLTVKLAQVQSDYTKKWQDQLKNGKPGDMEMASNFIDDFDDNADSIRDGIQTRAGQLHFAKANAMLRQHFIDTANAGQAEMLGVQAQSNFQEARQARMSTLADDPGSYWATKDMQNQDVDTLIGKIPRHKVEEERIASRKMLAEAAVRGQIIIDPSVAKTQLEGGKWDSEMDSTVKFHMLAEARAGVRAQRTDELLAAQARQAALQAAQDATKNKFLNRINDPSDKDGTLTWKDIYKSNLDPHDKEHFKNILDKASEDGVNKPNPALFNDTLRRILLPDGHPDKVSDDRLPLTMVYAEDPSKRLPIGDAQKLISIMDSKKSQQGSQEADLRAKFVQNVAVPSITKDNPVVGYLDTEGHNRLYNFQFLMDKKIQEQRANNQPIEDLYNPQSPSYLGKYIPQFQTTTNDVINNFSKKMSASAPQPAAATEKKSPRKPGETPQQYLERTK